MADLLTPKEETINPLTGLPYKMSEWQANTLQQLKTPKDTPKEVTVEGTVGFTGGLTKSEEKGTFTDINRPMVRAANQSRLQATGQAMKGIVPNIVTGLVAQAGYVPEIAEYVAGKSPDWTNSWVEWSNDARVGSVYKAFPGIDLGDPKTWIEGGAQMVESIAQFYLTGRVAALPFAALGAKTAKGINAGATATKALTQGLPTVGTSFTLASLEAAQSASQVWQQAYDKTGDVELASQAASTTFRNSTLVVGLTGLTTVAPLFRGSKASLAGLGLNKLEGEGTKEFLTRLAQSSYNPSTVNTLRTLAYEMGQESFEELGNVAAEAQGKSIAEGKPVSYFDSLIQSASSDEGIMSMALGAFGGAGQIALVENIPLRRDVIQPDGSTKKEWVSPRKLEIREKQKIYKEYAENLVKDLTNIQKYQSDFNIAVAKNDEAAMAIAKDNLFNITLLNSLKNGTATNLISTFEELGKADNSTEVSPGKTEAMIAGLTNSKEDNSYKETAQQKIKDIKHLTSEYENLSTKFENQDVVNSAFSSYLDIYNSKQRLPNLQKSYQANKSKAQELANTSYPINTDAAITNTATGELVEAVKAEVKKVNSLTEEQVQKEYGTSKKVVLDQLEQQESYYKTLNAETTDQLQQDLEAIYTTKYPDGATEEQQAEVSKRYKQDIDKVIQAGDEAIKDQKAIKQTEVEINLLKDKFARQTSAKGIAEQQAKVKEEADKKAVEAKKKADDDKREADRQAVKKQQEERDKKLAEAKAKKEEQQKTPKQGEDEVFGPANVTFSEKNIPVTQSDGVKDNTPQPISPKVEEELQDVDRRESSGIPVELDSQIADSDKIRIIDSGTAIAIASTTAYKNDALGFAETVAKTGNVLQLEFPQQIVDGTIKDGDEIEYSIDTEYPDYEKYKNDIGMIPIKITHREKGIDLRYVHTTEYTLDQTRTLPTDAEGNPGNNEKQTEIVLAFRRELKKQFDAGVTPVGVIDYMTPGLLQTHVTDWEQIDLVKAALKAELSNTKDEEKKAEINARYKKKLDALAEYDIAANRIPHNARVDIADGKTERAIFQVGVGNGDKLDVNNDIDRAATIANKRPLHPGLPYFVTIHSKKTVNGVTTVTHKAYHTVPLKLSESENHLQSLTNAITIFFSKQLTDAQKKVVEDLKVDATNLTDIIGFEKYLSNFVYLYSGLDNDFINKIAANVEKKDKFYINFNRKDGNLYWIRSGGTKGQIERNSKPEEVKRQIQKLLLDLQNTKMPISFSKALIAQANSNPDAGHTFKFITTNAEGNPEVNPVQYQDYNDYLKHHVRTNLHPFKLDNGNYYFYKGPVAYHKLKSVSAVQPSPKVEKTVSDIEAKKADIERRRQEEIKNMTVVERSDYTLYNNNPYEVAVKIINAKYDAELAALETPTTPAPKPTPLSDDNDWDTTGFSLAEPVVYSLEVTKKINDLEKKAILEASKDRVPGFTAEQQKQVVHFLSVYVLNHIEKVAGSVVPKEQRTTIYNNAIKAARQHLVDIVLYKKSISEDVKVLESILENISLFGFFTAKNLETINVVKVRGTVDDNFKTDVEESTGEQEAEENEKLDELFEAYGEEDVVVSKEKFGDSFADNPQLRLTKVVKEMLIRVVDRNFKDGKYPQKPSYFAPPIITKDAETGKVTVDGSVAIPKYLGFDEAYTKLQSVLVNTDPSWSAFKARLEEAKPKYPWIHSVLEMLEPTINSNWDQEKVNKVKDKSNQLKRAFIYSMLTVKNGISYLNIVEKKDGTMDMTVDASDISEVSDVIMESWKESLSNSPLILHLDEDIYSKEGVDEALRLYEVANTTKSIDDVKALFEYTGLELSPDALKEFGKTGLGSSGLTSLFAERRLLGKLGADLKKISESTTPIALAQINIFESGSFKALAKLQARFSDAVSANSITGLTGEKAFEHGKPRSIHNIYRAIMKPLSESNLAVRKYKIPFNNSDGLKYNNWLSLLSGKGAFSENFRKAFKIGAISGLKWNNKPFEVQKHTPQELETDKIGMFQYMGKPTDDVNAGYRYKSMYPWLIPGRDTVITVTALRFRLEDKLEFDDKGQIIIDDNTLDALLFVADSEVKRGLQAQETPTGTNYDKTSQKYWGFTKLNDETQLFSEGKMLPHTTTKAKGEKESNLEIVKRVVKQEITDLINSKIDDWKKYGIIKENKLVVSDSRYIKEIKQYGNNIPAFAAADFVINSLLANWNIYQVFSGDPAQVASLEKKDGSVNIERQWESVITKRLSKDGSPSVTLPEADNKYELLIALKDADVDSTTVSNSKKYMGITGTDGFTWVTVRKRLTDLLEQGKIPDSVYRELITKYQNFRNGKGKWNPTVDEIRDYFTITKPRSTELVPNETFHIDEIRDEKTSEGVLEPSMTAGFNLDQLRGYAEKLEDENKWGEDITQSFTPAKLVYKSALKTMVSAKPQVVHDDNGDVKPNLQLKAIKILKSGSGIQQDTPVKNYNEVSTGSQKLILSVNNIKGVKGFKLNDEELTAEAIIQKYVENYGKLTELGTNKAVNKITTDGNLNVRKLNALILDTAKASGTLPPNFESDLKVLPTGEYNRPLYFATSRKKIEQTAISIFNKVVKSKTYGRGFILAPEEGMRLIKDRKAESKMVYFPGYDPTVGLKGMREENGKVLPAQVFIPWTLEQDLEKYVTTTEDGKRVLNTDKIDPEVLKGFSFRIPTQEQGSMAAVEIVGFMPKIMGNTIIASRDLIAQIGHDFDLDKLYTYMYNIYIDTEVDEIYKFGGDRHYYNITSRVMQETSITEEQPAIPDYKDWLKGLDQELLLQNERLDIYRAIFNHPEVLKSVREPIDAGKLETVADIVREARLARNKIKSPVYISEAYMSSKFLESINGGSAIGVEAVDSIVLSLIQQTGDIRLNKYAEPEWVDNYLVIGDENGKPIKVNNLSDTKTKSGKNRTQVASHFVSSAVDNEKKPIHGILNFNNFTHDAKRALKYVADEEYIGYFLSQDIIFEYTEMMQAAKSGLSKGKGKTKVEIIAELEKKYSNIGNTFPINDKNIEDSVTLEDGTEYALSVKDLKGALGIVGGKVDLENGGENYQGRVNYNEIQRLALKKFDKMSAIGSKIGSLQKALRVYTTGISNGIMGADYLWKNYKEVLDKNNKGITNVDKLFKGTIPGHAINVLDKANTIYRPLFPYHKENFTNIIKELEHNLNQKGNYDEVRELSVEKKQEIWDNYISYLMSSEHTHLYDYYDIRNVDTIRESLLLETDDNKSHATNTKELQKVYPDNLFLKRLSTNIFKNKKMPSIVKYQAYAVEGHNEPEIKRSLMDLVATEDGYKWFVEHHIYNIITGGVQNPNNTVKYLSETFFSITGLDTYLRELNMNDPTNYGANPPAAENDYKNVSRYIKQYIQHNPWDAPQVEAKVEGNTITLENNPGNEKYAHLYRTTKDGVFAVNFISIADANQPKGYRLFQRTDFSNNVNTYTEIPTLGYSKKRLHVREYNANADKVKALFSNVKEVPNVQRQSTGKTIVSKEQVKSENQPDNIEDALKEIIQDKDSSIYQKKLAEIFIKTPLRKDNPKIHYEKLSVGQSASYDSVEDKITIDPKRASKSRYEDTLHEYVHSGIDKLIIAYYDNKTSLTEAQIKSIEGIINFRKTILSGIDKGDYEGLNTKDLDKFNKLFAKIINKTATQEEATEAGELTGKYYPFLTAESESMGVREFVTNMLTRPSTQAIYSKIPWTETISLADRFIELITKAVDALINGLGLNGKQLRGSILHESLKHTFGLINTLEPETSVEKTVDTSKHLGITKIISGGQTGVDMAGLDAAVDLGITTGGTAAAKFKQSTGKSTNVYNKLLATKYGLKEGKLTSREGQYGKYDDVYYQRTIDNAQEADGTVWFGKADSPGGKLTLNNNTQKGKPRPIINPTVEELKEWITKNNIKTLNVAGNREWTNPGIYEKAKNTIIEALTGNTVDTSKPINIYAGTNENAELSNFAPRPFTIKGKEANGLGDMTYKSVEQAFQYYKTFYANSSSATIGSKILKSEMGSTLKALGRQIDLNTAQWDKVSSKIMKDLLLESFKQNPEALKKLLATGDAELTHTQDKGKWGKEFPRLLMEVRAELAGNTASSAKDTGSTENTIPTEVKKQTKKEFEYKGKTIPTEFQLGDDQEKALQKLVDFTEDNTKKIIVLQGAAGTGKTSIIGYLQKYLGEQFLYTAPTHAATVELAFGTMRTGNKILPITVASSMKEDKSLGIVLSKKATKKIGFGRIIIVDETSMISRRDYQKLKDLSKNGYKIVFLGDKKQIPEIIKGNVAQKNISEAFTENEIINLDTIYRTSNEEIKAVLQKIRDSVTFQLYKIKENTKNLKFIKDVEFKTLLREFVVKDPQNIDYIGYTNASVKAMNKLIREHIFDRHGEIQKDDIVIGYLGYASKQIEKGNLANSVSFKVENVTRLESSYVLKLSSERLTTLRNAGFKEVKEFATTTYYPLSKKDALESDFDETAFKKNNEFLSNIFVELAGLFNLAKKTNAKRDWAIYQDAQEAVADTMSSIDLGENYIYNYETNLFEFYDNTQPTETQKDLISHYGTHLNNFVVEKGIDFGHGITIHKSQGRTTRNVFFDANTITSRDIKIMENGKQISTERQSLGYVGMSRASENLFVNEGWVDFKDIDNTETSEETNLPEGFSKPDFSLSIERLPTETIEEYEHRKKCLGK